MKTRAAFAGGFAIIVAATIAFVSLRPYPAVANGRDSYTSDRLAAEMDPELLSSGFADRTVIEVDWVDGCEPGQRTIDGLREILKKYSPAGRPIEVFLDQCIPRAEWNGLPSGPERVNRLVQRFAGADRAVPGTSWRYILFVPELDQLFGHTIETYMDRGGTIIPVSGVVVSRSAHQKFAKLWISLDLLERMTLIHEFGHEFGLVSNPDHERSEPMHRHHCNSLHCVMAHPTPRVIARNIAAGLFNKFMTDYCAQCQKDIRDAQSYWASLGASTTEYRASREAKRAVRAAMLLLRHLADSGQFEAMLERVRDCRSKWPEKFSWDGYEVEALRGLGRIDEAIRLQERSLSSDPHDPDYWRTRWTLAESYMVAGRYDAAITTLDRRVLSLAEEQDFEQSAFVLQQALSSAHRFDEAAQLVDELLARGMPQSYSPERMRVRRAELVRRAGHLAEADAVVSDALADRKRRAAWLEEAARLRHAEGRSEEEHQFWEQALSSADHASAAATNETERRAAEWQAIASLARLDRVSEARTRLSKMADGSGASPRMLLYTELPARAALGDFSRIAELIRSIPAYERVHDDPCQIEDLEPMRRAAEYAGLFVTCPTSATRNENQGLGGTTNKAVFGGSAR